MKRFKARQIYLLFILILSGFLITGCGSGGGEVTEHWAPARQLMSIEVTPPNPIIATATTQQFMATGIYSENTHFDLTSSVTWSSSNTNIATISNETGSKGLAHALTAGTTTITATDTATGKSGYTTLTVKPTAVTLMTIEVYPPNPTIALGTNQPFIATGIYSDATTQNLTSSVTWTSSNTGIATIDTVTDSVTKGLATSKAVGGPITITAASGTISGTAHLTVTAATLVSIAVTPPDASIPLGLKQQFIAWGTYTDGTKQNLTSLVTWSSSDTTVATISNAADGSNGLATSLAVGGPITITAASGTISGTAQLTVTAARLVSIAVTPVNPSIALGTKQQFIATGTYTNATTQVLTSSVTWTSETTTVAAIDTAPGSATKGEATSLAIGTTKITATFPGPNVFSPISGNTTLTVTNATLVSLEVTPADAGISVGATQQFIATGTYTDDTTQDLTSSVTWSTPSMTIPVASISNAEGSKGLATALTVGGPIRIHAIDPATLKFGNAKLTVTNAANLRAAAPFGFFSSAALTNMGDASVIDGDAGTTGVASSITGLHDALGRKYTETCPSYPAAVGCGLVTGTIYASDAPIGDPAGVGLTVKAAAAAALVAFNDLGGRAGGLAVEVAANNLVIVGAPTAGELGGRTLAPGIYKSTPGTYAITAGNLTLDAQGNPNAVWVFQTAADTGTLTVSTPAGPLPTSANKVLLINGAQAKNVFWYVPAGAVINTGSQMVGTMIANAAITFGTATGSNPVIVTTLDGRALVLNAGATMVNTVINVPAP